MARVNMRKEMLENPIGVLAAGALVIICHAACYFLIIHAMAVIVVMLMSFYPSFSIQTFYVPSLNEFNQKALISPDADSLVFFDLQLQNSMWYKGVHYDAVNLTFSYYSPAAGVVLPIANYTIKGFYQGKGKTAHRRDVTVATGGGPWREAVMSGLSNGSTADFKVDLITKVKFNNYLWYTSKKRMVSRGIVKVGDSGRIVLGKKAGVVLKNSSQVFTMVAGNCVAVVFLVLIFIFCGGTVFKKVAGAIRSF